MSRPKRLLVGVFGDGEALADGDWHDATPIRTQLAQGGISKGGIDRAVTDLGVEHRRTEAFPSTTQWRLARGGAVTGVTGVTGVTANGSDPSRPSRPSRTAPTNVGPLDAEAAIIDQIVAAFDATEVAV